jgi:hypothetical protein
MTIEKVQLTNEQIARVFAMYHGHEFERVYFYASDGSFHSREITRVTWKTIEQGTKPPSINIGKVDCKLLLTPLSAISDEDAIEVAKMMDWHVWLASI